MFETEKLPGMVHVGQDKDQLFDDLGLVILAAAQDAVRERGVFHVALSGGSTPEPFYIRLVTDPQFRAFPWDQTHLWLVDERRVAEDSDESNIRMIRESLSDHTTMRKRQVHPMPVLSNDPATEYEATLGDVLGQSQGDLSLPQLDFVLLGMGDDCHTASLFPGSPAIDVSDRWIAVNEGTAVTPPDRVTMTYPLINAARQIAILACGEKKTPALQRVADLDNPNPTNVPVSGIHPNSDEGELEWYIDQAATGGQGG